MKPVYVADRAQPSGAVNAISRARAELAAGGVTITELSDSNPTRHGLTLPDVLATVRNHTHDAERYEPTPRGRIGARTALAAAFGGEPGDYWLTSSTSQAYAWLAILLADPGQALAVPTPGYPLVPPIARLAGVDTVDYRLHYVHGDGWLVDPERLTAAARDPRVRGLVVVNPGNPTGAYLHADAETIVAACAAERRVLISDEVFAPFALDGAPTSFGGETRIPTFTLGGLSKLLCAPQLKLGWIRLSGPAADLPPIREALDRIADAFLPVNEPVAAALPDLLTLVDRSVAAVRTRLAGNLRAVHAVFDDGAYRVRRCEGGWTVVVDVPRYLPSEDLVVELLRRHRLGVHPGWFYDMADDAALAISLLPEPPAFAATMGMLRAAIDSLA